MNGHIRHQASTAFSVLVPPRLVPQAVALICAVDDGCILVDRNFVFFIDAGTADAFAGKLGLRVVPAGRPRAFTARPPWSG